ncbi:MAG: PQQ-binding-like beta-propeller repeat protein [Chitinophagaceae bacterium]
MYSCFKLALLFLSLLIFSCNRQSDNQPDFSGWPNTGNTGNSHYSSLTQIDSSNVNQLKQAWLFHSDDLEPGQRSEIQCNPIFIDGVLYATSPRLKLLAIDGVTGKLKWSFDPITKGESVHANRGVMYWRNGDDQRILYTAGSRLYAIDALTGKPVLSFGKEGSIDLKSGLDADAGAKYVIATSPGVVFNNLVIIGSRVSEENGAAPGHIRAFNIITGNREWIFHTIPHPGEYGYETWPADAWKTVGGVNSWSGMTLDPETGIVYIPLGSPSFDFYGGNRKGQNLFGNSLLALDAATGKRVWHYQTVHHDIWDRDLPAPPALVTVERNGKTVKAVAQISKQGFVFVFDRATGETLFKINELPVPKSDLMGEDTWPTQPYPEKPAPFVRQHFSADEITNLHTHDQVFTKWKGLKSNNLFTPPSKEGTVILPGFDGGGEWGGAAYDPASSLLYINASEMPWILTMVEAQVKNKQITAGEQLYQVNCASCHGLDLSGEQHQFPSLIGIGSRMSLPAIRELMSKGKGRMPSYNHLPESDRYAIIGYITGAKDQGGIRQVSNQDGEDVLPYIHTGYHRFLDSMNYPAIKPPWGILTAIDLNTGEARWKVPLGEYKELTAMGIPITGTENYGGPLVTAGGLLFIAATKDEKFRAFDKYTGKLIWETDLPAGGYATPCTYMVNGKQYIVIATGGGKMGTKSSDTYIAFSLP